MAVLEKKFKTIFLPRIAKFGNRIEKLFLLNFKKVFDSFLHFLMGIYAVKYYKMVLHYWVWRIIIGPTTM